MFTCHYRNFQTAIGHISVTNMDVVRSENVKVNNAVLVSGLTHSEGDNEVFEFLKQFGRVTRLVEVPSPDKEVEVIVEFQHEATVKELEKRYLPLDRLCTGNPEISHRVQSLRSVYGSAASASVTEAYLSELKGLAKQSSKPFADILREELARIGESIEGGSEVTVIEPPVCTDSQPLSSDPQEIGSSPTASYDRMSSKSPEAVQASQLSGKEMNQPYQLSSGPLSTPEVQRVIAEHIVKNSDILSQPSLAYKLKIFSGRVPHPAFEVDYDAWQNSVEFCLNDPAVSEALVVRKIVESLSPPAANIVKSLGPKAHPQAYLKLLDSAYATVEDGDELFA